MNMKDKNNKKIAKDVPLSDLAQYYPDIAEYLTDEYGFHCMNCFLSEFETLEDGAATHGIFGDEFEELMDEVNELAANMEPIETP
jgi:hybrid cluster-associated redox disulfide protein